MAIDKGTVKYVAHLARMELTAKEMEKLAAQLTGILDFIDKLNQLDIKDISPTSHILPIKDIFRQDNPGVSLPIDKTLKNAPQKDGSFFVVPKVID